MGGGISQRGRRRRKRKGRLETLEEADYANTDLDVGKMKIKPQKRERGVFFFQRLQELSRGRELQQAVLRGLRPPHGRDPSPGDEHAGPQPAPCAGRLTHLDGPHLGSRLPRPSAVPPAPAWGGRSGSSVDRLPWETTQDSDPRNEARGQ